ncbi:MAG: PEP-CTERM sorting domain-containing protein [Planctomycetota bacterium]|nr:MAG: PEP-CTERM sorting domain-containing protein [Planctomycetota bacterium]
MGEPWSERSTDNESEHQEHGNMHVRTALCLVFFFLLTGPAAAVHRVTQLTDTRISGPGFSTVGVTESHPTISGANIAWQGPLEASSSDDQEIFFFDGASITQLTDDALNDVAPQLSGSNLVWYGDDGTDSEIFYYDGSVISQITSNSTVDAHPQISGNNIVWHGWDGNDYEIFHYDGVTTTQITNNNVDDDFPKIAGSDITWRAWDGNDYELFYYDGLTTTQITNNSVDDKEYQISSGTVVWEASDGDDEIYFFDGTTTTQLTQNSRLDQDPQISGSNIVWNSYDGSDYQIMLYDGTTTTQLGGVDSYKATPQVSGDYVAWLEDVGGGSNQVFLYDGSTTTQVSDTSTIIDTLVLSGDRLAWRAWEGTVIEAEIYMASPVDFPSNASLATSADINELTIDFGTLSPYAAEADQDFVIANLVGGAGITAFIDLVSVNGSGNTDAMTTNVRLNLRELDGGESLTYTATFVASDLGQYQASYDFAFVDELGNNEVLTLNLTAEVGFTDDPNIPDLIYNAATGEVILDPDDSSIIGYALQNTGNSFLPGNHTPVLGGVATATTIQVEEASLAALTSSASIGSVFPTGMNITELFDLLSTNQVSRSLGSPLVPFDLIVIPVPVPEPSTLVLSGLALAALAAYGSRCKMPRRRRSCSASNQ